jgi:hypothetical protein
MLYGMDKPKTEQMLRGTEIHEVMELALAPRIDPIPLDESVRDIATGRDCEWDDGVVVMGQLLKNISDDHGQLHIISLEEKIIVYDEENDCTLVGQIDGLFQHPDGGIIIVELKTGNLTTSKLSRFRRELAFYKRVLELSGRFPNQEITHYCIIAPDCVDEKLVTSLLEQKRQKRDIFLGDLCGIAIIEPVGKRGISGMEKNLVKAVEGIKTHEWPIKWNDYFCMEWCDYNLSCEAEMAGGESALEVSI